MQLTKASFNNFRCFKNYQIEFGRETTVFIGKNGTGKSSILSGIRRGLSFMFAKPKNYSRNLATSNNAVVKSFENLEFNFDEVLKTYNTPLETKFEGFFNEVPIAWALLKKQMDGGLTTSEYSSALNSILSYYNTNPLAPLPVLLLFADSFPHDLMNSGAMAKKIIQQDILPRDFGYYGWIEKTNCIELWLSRYLRVREYTRDNRNLQEDTTKDIEIVDEQIFILRKRIDWKDEHDEHQIPDWAIHIKELKERRKELISKIELIKSDKRGLIFKKERDFIESKIIEFTKPISEEYNFINSDFEIYRLDFAKRDNEYELEFYFKDGRVIAFPTLPMGYKRIFSLLIDLAYRSYILNEEVESEGIVLIDEIELHLHPTLQQEILQRLRRTFPKIQFILTTHSPLVISNFKVNETNKIIRLEQEGTHYFNEEVENVFGLDYSTNLNDIMEVAPRSSTIDKYINGFLFLYGKGKKDEAEKLLLQLKDYVGGAIPSLMQAEIDQKKKQYEN